MGYRYFETNKWYRIPNDERLVLNTNWWVGKNRFVMRVKHPVRPAIDPASDFASQYPYPQHRDMICGTGYGWEDSSFYALQFDSDAVAVEFQLRFC